jgi:beta-mannanase
VKKYPHKIFMTIEHEPEPDVGGTGKSAADYVAMYRYIVLKMRSLGVTNVVWVMNYMGYKSWTSVFDSIYPGDDVVDWIAYDPYGFKEHTDFGVFLDTPKAGWTGFYTWATKKAPGKPIMLGEWGWDLARQPNAPAILDGAVPILQSRFPMLKALVYWNDDAGGFSVRLDQPTTLGRSYGQAYTRFANQSYFNQTSPSLAP